MKKRNYVVAISLIALLAQTGGLSAMEWGREQVGRAKETTMRAGRWTKRKVTESFDSLYDKAKDFVKEVKTLKRCHKAGDCTPEQYSKIKKMGAGLAAATLVAIGVGGLGIGAAVQEARDLEDQAAKKFEIKNPIDIDFLKTIASSDVNILLNWNFDKYFDPTINAAIWIIGKRPLSQIDKDNLISRLNELRKQRLLLP